MKSIRTAHLVYFSGTGCTAWVAKQFEASLHSNQIEIMKTELNGKKAEQLKADLLVLIFPVYAFNAPQPVYEWIDKMLSMNGLPVAVISVSGGGAVFPNIACRAGVIKRLEQKGYDVCYEAMLVMPSNFLIQYSDMLCAMILKVTPNKVEDIVHDLLCGIRKRTKPRYLDRLISSICVIERWFARIFGKCLKSNSNCSGCGWCARQCPRGNISMRDGKPVYGSRCVLCLRCVYGCPQNAISPRLAKFVVLKSGFNIHELIKHADHLTETPSKFEIANTSVPKGIKKYLE